MIKIFCSWCHKKQEITRELLTGVIICKTCNNPINEPEHTTEH